MSPITLRDGLGATFTVAAELVSGILTPHSVPEVGGLPVTPGNPMPVAAVQTGTWSVALGSALPAGTNLLGQFAPVANVPVSRSVATVAATSALLMPANPGRRQFWFQAPQGAGIWINRLGGTAGPNLADCTYWPAGAYYETGPAVSISAVTYYCATAGLMLTAGEI
jgi:hypothetical protein